MANYPRYAIYYAPALGSDLDRFGAHLLGYDAFGGGDLPFADGIEQTVPDWRELTQDPRKYGFHATLKAPMPLAPDATEAELLAACESFAGTPRKIPVIRPVVDSISGFIAVLSAEPSTELERLAADCTRDFDSFRAPLTPEDRARRNPSRLTPRQRDYLERWGYPYVMAEFRFHVTLTGPIDLATAAGLEPRLAALFAAAMTPPLAIDALALFVEAAPGAPFRLLRRMALSWAAF
jgi:putative phosphonate metabolism protein